MFAHIVFNLANLVYVGAAGLVFNAVIGRVYGASALGIFNIVFAIYIFASQFGSAGLQYSALRFVSLATDRQDLRAAAYSSIFLVLITSTLAVLAAWLAVPVVRLIYPVVGLESAYLLSLPGLWCFSVNKVLLGIINGASHMRAFAVFQSARYTLMLAALSFLVATKQPGEYMTLTLSAAEILLLPVLFAYVRVMLGPYGTPERRVWMRRHLQFGLSAMPSGVVGELNTRVDVLLLGSMLGAVQTGIYSMAILLAEGFGQVVFVISNVINPKLATIVATRDQRALRSLFIRVGISALGIMSVAGAALFILYPLINRWLLGGQFDAALVPLGILVTGLTLTAPIMIFTMILSQGGRPGLYSLFACTFLAANVVLNLIGINAAGIVGAATGTALSFVFAAALLVIMIKHVFGLKLL